MKKLNVVVCLLSIVALFGCIGYFYHHYRASRVKYVTLRDGMCNQMQQYMFGKYIEKKFGCKVKFIKIFPDDCGPFEDAPMMMPRKYMLEPFNVNVEFAPVDILSKGLKINFQHSYVYKGLLPKDVESKFPKPYLEREPLNISDDVDIWFLGSFFLGKEFNEMRDEFVKDFSLKAPLNDANKDMLEKIKSCNSVSMHVRRTDFLSGNKDVKDIESYHKAADEMASKVKDPHFFIFSDDIKWCKENLKLKYPHTFVDINGIDEGYFDLELMKNCKHNINQERSSFSRMASWLNENPNKVILVVK